MIIFASLEGPPVSLFELESSIPSRNAKETSPSLSPSAAQMVVDAAELPISLEMTPPLAVDGARDIGKDGMIHSSSYSYNPFCLSNAIGVLLFVTLTTQVVKRTTFRHRKKV